MQASIALYVEVAGKSINTAAGLLQTIGFWNELDRDMDIHRADKAVFNLLTLAQIEPVGESVEKVEYLMQRANEYVQTNAMNSYANQ